MYMDGSVWQQGICSHHIDGGGGGGGGYAKKKNWFQGFRWWTKCVQMTHK